MFDRAKTAKTLEQHTIFGDEEAAALRSAIDSMQGQIADLNARVHSQFTTIAAHAEIARTQAEFARDEARADLDRTRETVIGLIEHVRSEHVGTSNGQTTSSTGSDEHSSAVTDGVVTRLADIESLVHQCFQRQQELADTMTAVIDSVFAEQRGEPVLGLALA